LLLIQSPTDSPQYLCWWVLAAGRLSSELEWQPGTGGQLKGRQGLEILAGQQEVVAVSCLEERYLLDSIGMVEVCHGA